MSSVKPGMHAMAIQIDKDDHARLKKAAKADDRSVGYVIRLAIRQYLATIEKEAA